MVPELAVASCITNGRDLAQNPLSALAEYVYIDDTCLGIQDLINQRG